MERFDFLRLCKTLLRKDDIESNGYFLKFIREEDRKNAIKLFTVGFNISDAYHVLKEMNKIVLIGEDGVNMRKLYMEIIIRDSQKEILKANELTPFKVFSKNKSKLL